MKEHWLHIKANDYYGETDIIEFDKNMVKHFSVEKKDNISLEKNVTEKWTENLSEVEHIFKNPNRIRFIKKGEKHTAISETESLTEDCIFELDYEKLYPTQTELTEDEIQNLKFEIDWNGEKIIGRFNEALDPPFIQEINKRMNTKGRRIILEKLNDTLFLSFYFDAYTEILFPIKYVDKQRMVLYGFPKEPYEVDCKVLV